MHSGRRRTLCGKHIKRADNHVKITTKFPSNPAAGGRRAGIVGRGHARRLRGSGAGRAAAAAARLCQPPPPPPRRTQPAVDVEVHATEAPPPLPDYDQPPCPEDGYLWTPGYWAWGGGGYYWVPGTWVQPPRVGVLWTPGYWGFVGGVYAFHAGYWGPHVGFYGGVNYGFGYVGVGFVGGRWAGNSFAYNRTVNNVNVTNVHNTYNETVVNNVTRQQGELQRRLRRHRRDAHCPRKSGCAGAARCTDADAAPACSRGGQKSRIGREGQRRTSGDCGDAQAGRIPCAGCGRCPRRGAAGRPGCTGRRPGNSGYRRAAARQLWSTRCAGGRPADRDSCTAECPGIARAGRRSAAGCSRHAAGRESAGTEGPTAASEAGEKRQARGGRRPLSRRRADCSARLRCTLAAGDGRGHDRLGTDRRSWGRLGA